MEVLESPEKMDLGLQGRVAIAAAASKRCVSSAAKQPADGLPLSNSLSAAATGFACTPTNEYAPFGIAVNPFGQGTITAPLDTLAKSISKRSNVKLEEVSAGRPRRDSRRPNRQARAVSGGGWRSDYATLQLRRPNVSRRGWHAGSEPPLVDEQIQAAL
jgi:hypothetical protein